MSQTTINRGGRPPVANPRNVRVVGMVTAETAGRIEELRDGLPLSEWVNNAVLAYIEAADRREARRLSRQRAS